jgi:P27 family predicted phage terminase small subunit
MPARKPAERKRLTGRSPGKDSGGRPLPVPVAVPEPLTRQVVPAPPEKLGTHGLDTWNRLWQAGAGWLHAECDRGAMVRLCELVDVRARVLALIDSAGVTTVGSMGQVRAHPLLASLTSLETAIGRLEAECGFTPAARSKLSASEVSRASKLDDMLARRAAGRLA